MLEQKTPLDYAKNTCDTLMHTWQADHLPPEGRFHYHQGVFLSGMYKTYQLCHDEKYYNYIKQWVDARIDENGTVSTYDPGQMDDIQPAILLYPLYERTGDPRYKTALDTLVPIIYNFPHNPEGGLWHKERYPNQMWLDGLYMGGPVCAEYAKHFNKPEYTAFAIKQIKLMFQHTRDEKTGLLYHAWDYSKKAIWSNPVTGTSPEFWGRSIGWVPVAVLDDLDAIDTSNPDYETLCSLVRNLLISLCKFQSEDGRWYQVVNKGSLPENWLENSCSCLYTAALCKAVRKGILDSVYLKNAEKGYKGVIQSLTWKGSDIQIGNVCIGTGVGDYAFYCARPTSVNDLHGAGAFLLMCTEVQKILSVWKK